MPITTAERETISAYNAIAEARRGSVTTNINFWKPEFIDIIAGIKNPKFLDLGCGDGRDAALFHSTLDHLNGYLGVDLSPGMLLSARNRGLTNAALIEADIYRLPVLSGSIDIAWAPASLIHTPREQIEDQLLEIRRCLVENGRFFFVMKYGIGEKWEEGKNLLDKRYVVFWEEKDFSIVLEKSGFSVDSITVDHTRDDRGVVWMIVCGHKE